MGDEVLELLLTLDADGYVASARRVKLANNQIVDSSDALLRKNKAAKADLNDLGGTVSRLSGLYSAALGPLMAFGAAVGAVTIAGAGLATYTASRAADFESLTNALTAVEGSAEKAKKSLADLREIARGPGLGVTESIQTYMGLRRGGLDADMSQRLTRELGNMVAMSGGGKEVLGRAGLALSQIALTEFLQGDELRQLTEAGIPAYAIVKQLFGTADTEKLKRDGVTSKMVLAGLLAEMEKMPRVAGGAKNAWENLTDAVDQAAIQFGNQIIGAIAGPGQDATKAIENLTEAGVFGALADVLIADVREVFGGVFEGVSTAQDVFIEMGAVVADVSEAMRNLALNVNAIAEGLLNLNPFYHTSKKIAELTVGDDAQGLQTAGDRFRQQVQLNLDLAAARRRQAERNGQVTDEEAATTEQTPAARETAKTVPLLRQIAENTGALKRIETVMLGGGAFTNAAWSARNIGAWTGRGADMIIQGVRLLGLETVGTVAAHSTMQPRSV